MVIDLKTVVPTAIILWGLLKKWYNEIAKVAEPVILKVEECAKDGTIDKGDRKVIAMKIIEELERQGKIQKLNFLTKIIVSRIVDNLAAKLPDFTISQEIKDLSLGTK